MPDTRRLDEPCGHGLRAWLVDGVCHHERKDQNVALDGTKVESRGLMVDECDRPAKAVKGRGR